mgnify:FL=1
MKIPNNCKPEKAVSGDVSRRSITEPYLDKTDNGSFLVSTDCTILSALKVETDSNDTSGYVTKEAITEARKLKNPAWQGVISANGNLGLGDGRTYPRPDLGTFPSWQEVVPKERKEIKLKFNLQALVNLAEALGYDKKNSFGSIIINIPVDDTGEIQPAAWRVETESMPLGSIGLLMPIAKRQ